MINNTNDVTIDWNEVITKFVCKKKMKLIQCRTGEFWITKSKCVDINTYGDSLWVRSYVEVTAAKLWVCSGNEIKFVVLQQVLAYGKERLPTRKQALHSRTV